MSNKSIPILCLLLHLLRFLNAQQHQNAIDELITKKNLTFDIREIGLATRLSELDITSLELLITNENPINRIYGFWAIALKEGSDYRKYFNILVTDTAVVKIAPSGCMVSPPTEVGTIIYDLAVNDKNWFGPYNSYAYFLDNISLEMKPRACMANRINTRIYNIKPPSTLYGKLRERALAGEIYPMLALANFQREEDLPIFHKQVSTEGKNAHWGLGCIKRFPHPSFEETVLKRYYDTVSDSFGMSFAYMALILLKFDSPRVAQAIDSVISNPLKYKNHITSLWMMLNIDQYKDQIPPLNEKLIQNVGKNKLKAITNEYDLYKLHNEYMATQNKSLRR